MQQHSVTYWILALKAGDHAAAQPLFERYFEHMVRLARARLGGCSRRCAAEEDVALSAFASFCRGVDAGKFPLLRDRHNLWPLLMVITARKAIDLRDRELAQKRGGGAVGGESDFHDPGRPTDGKRGIEQVIDTEPSPEFVVELAEEMRILLAALPNETLRRVATLKLEGYTNDEIATRQ